MCGCHCRPSIESVLGLPVNGVKVSEGEDDLKCGRDRLGYDSRILGGVINKLKFRLEGRECSVA